MCYRRLCEVRNNPEVFLRWKIGLDILQFPVPSHLQRMYNVVYNVMYNVVYNVEHDAEHYVEHNVEHIQRLISTT